MHGGSQLDSQLRSVKSIALDHHCVHALTLLSSIVAGIGSEADRNDSHARNLARVEVLRELPPVDPRGAEQCERGLSTSAHPPGGPYDEGPPTAQAVLRKATPG